MNKSWNKVSYVQSQEAIRFSFRQIRDFKRITMELLNGMNSMKSIVEDTFCSEAGPSAPSKFTSEEIRMTTKDATDVEATTKKWLSMMSRDCNRFCKIIKSTENKAASPTNCVGKKKKNIIFADEAGGMLCHVKLFDQKHSAFVVTENEAYQNHKYP